MSPHSDHGSSAEEAVRGFLLQEGYFVVRAVPVRYGNDDATDIDCWAYGPGSATHRERVVVDSKFKRTAAQGFERLFWLEGVRRAVGVEHAILATTDGRDTLRSLATRIQVRVIGPQMFQAIVAQNRESARLSEEDFLKAVIPVEDKLLGQIRQRYQRAKSNLLRLDWDSANLHLEDVGYHSHDTMRRTRPEASLRLAYASVAYFLVTLDFATRDATFWTPKEVQKRVDEGIRFGTKGRAGVVGLLETLGARKKREALTASGQIPADIVAEYFHRLAGTSGLLQRAKEFEAAAFARNFIPPTGLSSEGQGTLGVLLDFLRIDRRAIFDADVTPRVV